MSVSWSQIRSFLNSLVVLQLFDENYRRFHNTFFGSHWICWRNEWKLKLSARVNRKWPGVKFQTRHRCNPLSLSLSVCDFERQTLMVSVWCPLTLSVTAAPLWSFHLCNISNSNICDTGSPSPDVKHLDQPQHLSQTAAVRGSPRWPVMIEQACTVALIQDTLP